MAHDDAQKYGEANKVVTGVSLDPVLLEDAKKKAKRVHKRRGAFSHQVNILLQDWVTTDSDHVK